MHILSPIQVEILDALLLFKQLTIPQLHIVIFTQRSHQSIRRNLQKLFERRRPLVNRIEFKKISHFGKLSYVYNLTERGVVTLERLHDIKISQESFTPQNPKLTSDYFHRTRTIDFHIHMKKNEIPEDYVIERCDYYFIVKKDMGTFSPVNSIKILGGKSIIPDMVTMINKGGKKRLLLFELHNGRDKRRISRQIKEHISCLINLDAHKKYGIETDRFYYILIVFEDVGVLKSVIKDFREDKKYINVLQFFLCKALSEINKGFLDKWVDLSGKSAMIKF